MLKPIKHLMDNPNDIPDVPRATKEYLQSSFNHAYLRETGVLKKMQQAGYSDSHILGFIEGLGFASHLLDEMELRKEANRE